MQVADFLGSLGVNTHLSYTDSQYARSAQALTALQYLGIGLVRDFAVRQATPNLHGYEIFAEAGIRFDMIFQAPRSFDATLAAMEAFARDHPGAIVAIEGPNEINNLDFAYAGLTGTEAGLAYMADMVAAVAGSPDLAGIDTFSMTGVRVSDAAEFANFHTYPRGGDQPYDWLAQNPVTTGVSPDKPLVLTEVGYHTALAPAAVWEGVDEATQAKLTLNLLFDAARLGIDKTFLYQLLDGYADPANVSVDRNIGLFDINFRPKVAATAIHNLTSVLGDEGFGFAGPAVVPRVFGLPASGATLTMVKDGGARDVVLWAEPDNWNQLTDRPISVASTSVVVDFGSRIADVRVFDPLLSDQPIATFDNVSFVTVGLTDHPLIVEAVDPSSWSGAPVQDPDRVIEGTARPNHIIGGGGDDRLSGFAGTDLLYASSGDDVLIGGGGADVLIGGAGADLFVYQRAGDAAVRFRTPEVIADFSRADGDRIDFSAMDAGKGVLGWQDFVLRTGGFTGAPGQLIQTVVANGVLLEGDTDGDRIADIDILLEGLTTRLQPEYFIL